MAEIAKRLGVGHSTVVYWMKKHHISRRSRSDAGYVKHNPNGDPFKIEEPKTLAGAELMGMGLGLYWGEGTKASKSQVRLGNTDPALIAKFIEFLEKTCGVKREKIRFWLQVFSDMHPEDTKRFWMARLNLRPEQFSKKIIVTPARSLGTYRKKSRYGVLTVYVSNVRLRNQLIELLRARGMEY